MRQDGIKRPQLGIRKIYPTYEYERDDLKKRLNHQLRKLRTLNVAERAFTAETKSYFYTKEMAYLLDDIQRGPVFFAPQMIRKANDLISDLESYVVKLEKTTS